VPSLQKLAVYAADALQDLEAAVLKKPQGERAAAPSGAGRRPRRAPTKAAARRPPAEKPRARKAG
jgi:hypothetical protein